GCHTAMVFAAISAGLQTVGQAMEDETVAAFLNHCLYKEILPSLGESKDALRFAADVLERFKNPFIKHSLRSIALNSVSKFSVRVLPSLKEYKNKFGTHPPGLVLSLAFLIHFYKNDSPEDLPEAKDLLKNKELPDILSAANIWGEDLSFLHEDVRTCLDKIDAVGAKGAMQWIMS
ncbi:MAG TPA: tagaturonate reductase, partial [Oscillospiraceae bacterium]|nr:tagaturonate reductase [Oscillospiraceae bacterium]